MPALRRLAEGGQTPKIDVVAIHGLNRKGKNTKQHAWDTWRKQCGDGTRLWLQDDLPHSLPDARIFLYEYNSQIFSGKQETFWDAANELLDCLWGNRRGDPLRPLLLVGHSLGGLLIKQALVNAHDNSHYAEIETSVKGLIFFGTPHEGGNQGLAKVKLGLAAANIARSLGFNSNDSVVQILTPGSLFGDFLRESFRHQLENYHIVSFFEKESTIVTKDSATFGLAGHREKILGLDKDHGNLCRFDTTTENDRDVYEFVTNAFYWLYDEAINEGALEERLEKLKSTGQEPLRQKDRDVLSRFYEATLVRVENLHDATSYYQLEETLDWVVHTSAYQNWSNFSCGTVRSAPVLWCQTKGREGISKAFGHVLFQKEISVIHVTNDNSSLADLSMVHKLALKHWAVSALLSILQQAYMLSFKEGDFLKYVMTHGLFNLVSDQEKLFSSDISRLVARLIRGNNERKWVVLIHDAGVLHKEVSMEVGRVLGRLVEATSSLQADNLKVVILGEDPQVMAPIARHSAVIDKNTEYLECLASLQFDNMNIRRDRISSATIGTNHWIWENPSYLAWKQRMSSVIWVAGKPGSGKSVLAKTMQEQLLKEQEFSQSLVASWFYSARDKLIIHRQMLSALLHQLLSQAPQLFNQVKDIYRSLITRRDGQNLASWSMEELKRAMMAIFIIPTTTLKSCLIVVDGLDEANTHDCGSDCSRPAALRFLLSLVSKTLPLRIIFLSRPSEDIRKILRNEYFISMHNVNRPDIVFLIEKGVKEIEQRLDGYDSDDEYSPTDTRPRSRSSTFEFTRVDSTAADYFLNAKSEKKVMLSDIDEYLRVNAKGVVLWVTTVIDILKRKCKEEPFCDINSLRAQLKSLPLELTDLYSQITANLLRSFQGNASTLAKSRRALMWVSVCSEYTLQLQDLLEVICHDFDEEDEPMKQSVFVGFNGWPSFKREIERLCGSFVEIIPVLPRSGNANDSDTTRWDILQLPHESVRTFLQQNEDLGFTPAEAEESVREGRKKYMRRTLPYLKPILFSSTSKMSNGLEVDYCQYMENRPLLCFILTTIEFELLHIIARAGGKEAIVSILERCNSMSARINGDRKEVPASWIFPFSPAACLLQACDFLDFIELDHPPTDVLKGLVGGPSYIQQLFTEACVKGQLNTVNSLSTLLISPRAFTRLAVITAMLDAADEVELEDLAEMLSSKLRHDSSQEPGLLDHVFCAETEITGHIDRDAKVRAAISQVAGSQIFTDTYISFWTRLADPESSFLLWGRWQKYESQLFPNRHQKSWSIHRRTPATTLQLTVSGIAAHHKSFEDNE